MLDQALRIKLAMLCLDRGRRINGWNYDTANRWTPNAVRHPDTFLAFTEAQAWEFISDKLREGHPVRVETYRAEQIPCCVMLVPGCDKGELIYIKIAHLPERDMVLGASFHISRSG